MKKILIINAKPHNKVGGIETYSDLLINLFISKGHQVFEISQQNSYKKIPIVKKNYNFIHHNYFKEKAKKNKFLIYIKLTINGFKINNLCKKIIKKYKIDVVIENNSYTYISFIKNVKYIWIQHFDWPIIKGSFFTKIIKKILFIKSRLAFPNIVVYTKNDINFLKKNKLVSSKTNIISITPGIFSLEYVNSLINTQIQNKSEITFIGRLENKQKNITFLNEITNHAKLNNKEIIIHVYGEGADKILLENNKNIILHESYNRENIKKILLKTKLLLVPSNYEGFGLVIAEALSHGIPCIIANTFLNASFLINDSRGKLMNNFNPQAWVDAINEIMNLNDDEYQKLSNNCLQFAKENLSLEQFNKKWLELIEG